MHLRHSKSKADLLKRRAHYLTDTLIDRAVDLSGTAATNWGPKVGTARDAASAAYGQASAKVRDDVVPRMRDDYAVRMREAAAPAIAAMLMHKQMEAEAEAEEQPPKHRLRKLLALLGLGAGVAFVAKKFGMGGGSSSTSFDSSSASDSWSSTTTPARPTAVPDSRDSSDPLQSDAAGATFADADADADPDADPGFATEFTTTPPTEVTPAGSDSDPKPGKGRS